MSNDAENSASITGINYTLIIYIKLENGYFKLAVHTILLFLLYL